jgi:DNA-directed RNA polymerase subunit M/transcription elongation factor TFIIS
MAEKDDIKKEAENRLSQPTKKQEDDTKQKFLLHIQKLENSIKVLEKEANDLREQNNEIILSQQKNKNNIERLTKIVYCHQCGKL